MDNSTLKTAGTVEYYANTASLDIYYKCKRCMRVKLSKGEVLVKVLSRITQEEPTEKRYLPCRDCV